MNNQLAAIKAERARAPPWKINETSTGSVRFGHKLVTKRLIKK